MLRTLQSLFCGVIIMSLKHLFDYKKILRDTPNVDKLKVTLKKTRLKGVGLYAQKPIKENATIAYYRMTVYPIKGFKSKTNEKYTFTLLTKKGNYSNSLIGDISDESLPPPCRNVPFWAYFSNEPSGIQTINARIDPDNAKNYSNRNVLRAGETVTFRLVAIRDIPIGEEIVWCYGDSYHRDYPVS